jgi:cation diffusion facilitator family transporter
MRQSSLQGGIYGVSCSLEPDAAFFHRGWVSVIIRLTDEFLPRLECIIRCFRVDPWFLTARWSTGNRVIMHIHRLDHWQHEHDFSVLHEHGERRTLQVLLLTITMMIFEVVAGVIFGSMALLADGWHMGTHAAAFMITIFAYRFARKHAASPAYAFGTGKVSVLGGFASAVALTVVALVMLAESAQRLFNPHVIHFNEAIGVAVIGLLVNIISAFLLQDHHVHEAHDHVHERHHHHHHDHNLKAAYLHVLADALTSVLAIIALLSGKYFGWNWLDPVMGIVGAAVIARWSYGLLRETGPVLLDESIDEQYRALIRQRIEDDADNRVTDLHVWRVGPVHYAVILSLVTQYPKPPEHYKALLADLDRLAHITIEANQCAGGPCIGTEQIPPTGRRAPGEI